MKEGDIVLTPLPQADGAMKPRPAVLLRQVPPFGDWLVCGVSTQLHQRVPEFDELVDSSAADFVGSGLKSASLVRLGFLTTLPTGRLLGVIGSISIERHQRLLHKLSDFLKSNKAV
jgi:mRNA interferase MazF